MDPPDPCRAYISEVHRHGLSAFEVIFYNEMRYINLSFTYLLCRDITGRLTMQTSLGLPEDPII